MFTVTRSLTLLAVVWSIIGLGGVLADSRALAEENIKMSGFRKPSREELKKKLTDLQFRVTQEDDTEPPFKNEYWDNKKPGIYVDVISGEPLFSSLDKFDSGTGWPSFTRPLEVASVIEKSDRKLWMVRTELRSKLADSHLGHVFDDGPKPTGKRYCINSAALRFVPVDRLKDEGYGEYEKLFAAAAGPTAQMAYAIFAGGCFWCMEPPFERLDGVQAVESGYSGGRVENPSYDQVTTGRTGHLEVVRVTYDPAKVSYDQLLEAFWLSVDPTDSGGQFVDRGEQYKSAIFVKTAEQRQAAEASRARLQASGVFGDKKIVTEIVDEQPFWLAEDYHQDYYKKNPIRYKYYRSNSGRDQFLEKVWGEKKDRKKDR